MQRHPLCKTAHFGCDIPPRKKQPLAKTRKLIENGTRKCRFLLVYRFVAKQFLCSSRYDKYNHPNYNPSNTNSQSDFTILFVARCFAHAKSDNTQQQSKPSAEHAEHDSSNPQTRTFFGHHFFHLTTALRTNDGVIVQFRSTFRTVLHIKSS